MVGYRVKKWGEATVVIRVGVVGVIIFITSCSWSYFVLSADYRIFSAAGAVAVIAAVAARDIACL